MHYLYLHSTLDGEPFYVGVGSKLCAMNTTRPEAAHAKAARHGVVVTLLPMETEHEALACEVIAIALFRLAGFNLINRNNGGAGAAIGHKHSEEVKARIRATTLATMSSPEWKAKRSLASKATWARWREKHGR